jgi:hypothetical protein
MHIPEEQGYPFLPPDTEFPFPRLLLFAWIRWRYSNLPPNLTCPVGSRYLASGMTVQKTRSPVLQLLRGC